MTVDKLNRLAKSQVILDDTIWPATHVIRQQLFTGDSSDIRQVSVRYG